MPTIIVQAILSRLATQIAEERMVEMLQESDSGAIPNQENRHRILEHAASRDHNFMVPAHYQGHQDNFPDGYAPVDYKTDYIPPT